LKLDLLSDAASPTLVSAGRKIKSALFHVQMRDYEPPLLKANFRQTLLVKFFLNMSRKERNEDERIGKKSD